MTIAAPRVKKSDFTSPLCDQPGSPALTFSRLTSILVPNLRAQRATLHARGSPSSLLIHSDLVRREESSLLIESSSAWSQLLPMSINTQHSACTVFSLSSSPAPAAQRKPKGVDCVDDIMSATRRRVVLDASIL